MNLRNKKSIEGARRQIYGLSNQSAFPGPKSQIVQSDRSDGLSTNKSDRPIISLRRTQDKQVGSSNQITLAGPTSRTDQSEIFYGPNFRIVQSDRSNGPTFRIDQSELFYGPTFRIDQSELWLVDTESRSVEELWLVNTESRSVEEFWLVDMESRSV